MKKYGAKLREESTQVLEELLIKTTTDTGGPPPVTQERKMKLNPTQSKSPAAAICGALKKGSHDHGKESEIYRKTVQS